MAYIKKAEQEKMFVDMILKKGGINSHCEMYERGHDYYCFWLKNREQRFWTDMSDESLKKLGIKVD